MVFNKVTGSRERYFFTELMKRVWKKKSKQRICRKVGKGFWSNKGQKTSICGGRKGKGVKIGYTRGSWYEIRKGHGNANLNSSDWLSKESILPGKYQDCVLKRKNGSGAGRDDRGDEPVECVLPWKPPAADDSSSCGISEELLLEQIGDDFALCVPKGNGEYDRRDEPVDVDDMLLEYSVWGLPFGEELLLDQIGDDYALRVPKGTCDDDRGDEPVDVDDMIMEYSVCGLPIELPAAADYSSSGIKLLLEQISDDFALCVDKGTGVVDRSDSVQLEKSSNKPNLIVIDDDDDDDECSILAAAAPIDLSLEGKKGDTNLNVIDDDDDECSILAAAAPIDFSLEGKKGDTDLIVIDDDDDDDDDDDECSMVAAAAPFDFTLEGKKGDTFTEDFNFGFSFEDNALPNDHFAWGDDDLFGDYQFSWAGLQMLPVSVI